MLFTRMVFIAVFFSAVGSISYAKGSTFFCGEDKYLYTGFYQGALYRFNSLASCEYAVDNSKNGFICGDNNYVYSENGALHRFGSLAECHYAVSDSKNGFICGSEYAYNKNGVVHRFGSLAECHYAVRTSPK